MCKQATRKQRCSHFLLHRRVLRKVCVIFNLFCKFASVVFIFADGRTFTTHLRKQTAGQTDMFSCIPNLKLAKRLYTLWSF